MISLAPTHADPDQDKVCVPLFIHVASILLSYTLGQGLLSLSARRRRNRYRKRTVGMSCFGPHSEIRRSMIDPFPSPSRSAKIDLLSQVHIRTVQLIIKSSSFRPDEILVGASASYRFATSRMDIQNRERISPRCRVACRNKTRWGSLASYAHASCHLRKRQAASKPDGSVIIVRHTSRAFAPARETLLPFPDVVYVPRQL